VRCSVLQVCCSVNMLPPFSKSSMDPSSRVSIVTTPPFLWIVLSVLQRVATCCSALQCAFRSVDRDRGSVPFSCHAVGYSVAAMVTQSLFIFVMLPRVAPCCSVYRYKTLFR